MFEKFIEENKNLFDLAEMFNNKNYDENFFLNYDQYVSDVHKAREKLGKERDALLEEIYLPADHVYDENKSVKWNRLLYDKSLSECEEINIQYEKIDKSLRHSIRELLVWELMHFRKYNRALAEFLEEKAYESVKDRDNSEGEEIMKLMHLSDFVEKVFKKSKEN